jgi:UDP-glucose 4-epimerase
MTVQRSIPRVDRRRLAPFAGALCVVTGGLGFIGSNLALALVEGGARVRIIDALIPAHGGNRHNIEDAAAPIEVLVAQLGDTPEIAAAVADADFVFNLAGQISHLDSMEAPLADFDWNARGQLAFLEVLRRQSRRPAIVYTSTRQIYGRPQYTPVDEAHPINPVDVNGVSQHAAEQFHLLYARVYGLRACSLRLTNVYGPRLRLTESRQGVIGVFLRRALQGERISVFGDGSQLRDFLHVDDVLDALLAAAVEPAAVGEAFNISHAQPLPLLRVAEAIVRAAGTGSVQLVPWPREHQAIDIGDFVGDYSKAKRVLGWEPGIPFEEGVAATVAFFREHRRWYL